MLLQCHYYYPARSWHIHTSSEIPVAASWWWLYISDIFIKHKKKGVDFFEASPQILFWHNEGELTSSFSLVRGALGLKQKSVAEYDHIDHPTTVSPFLGLCCFALRAALAGGWTLRVWPLVTLSPGSLGFIFITLCFKILPKYAKQFGCRKCCCVLSVWSWLPWLNNRASGIWNVECEVEKAPIPHHQGGKPVTSTMKNVFWRQS